MSIILADKEHCTGCAACSAVCSHSAISMVADVDGFLYPVIGDSCVECGLCVRTCPVLMRKVEGECIKCYAAKSRNRDVVAASSSGGVFSELANLTLKDDGVVFGAAYDEKTFIVSHIGINKATELHRLLGSKYVQSDIRDSYREVERALIGNKSVLFAGTPCQVAALRAFLRKDYNNLLLVDVICHGVPPMKLFSALISELENAHGKLQGFSFREKSEGWRSRAITGWYNDGVKIRENGKLNDYFRAFIKHLTLRHSCESCGFNAGRSGSDITLGDFWGVEKVLPEFDDNTGVSAVIIHTEKGLESFCQLGCESREVELSAITMSNPSYAAVRKKNPYRNRFMKHVWSIGISKAFAKYGGETLLSRVRRGLAKIIH